MKQIIVLSVVGLFALTLIGCGGFKTEDVEKVWKDATDSYYKEALEADDASKVKDIAKRLDEGAVKMGAKDWADLTVQAAKNDADGWKKMSEKMAAYSTEAAKKYSEAMTKKATEKAKAPEGK